MNCTFTQIGLVGTGAMGRGIAQIAAQAGAQVLLFDQAPQAAHQAKEAIQATWAKLADKGKLSAEQVQAMADLPPLPVLQAQLLGLLNSPASKLVRTLNEPGASLARVLKAKVDAGGGAA